MLHNSRTWAVNLRHLSKMYKLEDPLSSLQKTPPTKSSYKELILTKITSFHEKELKIKAEKNSKMKYMNVSLSSLRGRYHPCLQNIISSNEVKKLRPHIKFLTGDYLTYQRKCEDSGQGDPTCRICRLENESISPILTQCPAYDDIRNRILPEFSAILKLTQNCLKFENIRRDPNILTQFILDPTSFNLKGRVHVSDPVVPELFKVSRDYCMAVHTERTRRLQKLLNQ